MAIQQNQKRIRTTHIGSLPRPHAVLDLLKAKLNGQPYNQKVLDATVAKAVAEQVKRQVECGIDILSDGEMSKAGFFTYIRERLEGFESRPNEKVALFQKEVSAFPEYYEQYFKEAMMGGALAPIAPVVCVGPVKYVGEAGFSARARSRRSRRPGLQRVEISHRVPSTAEDRQYPGVACSNHSSRLASRPLMPLTRPYMMRGTIPL